MIDFDLILKYGKASSKIAGFESKPFIELPYGLVKIDLPALQRSESDSEAIINLIMKLQFPEFDIESASGNEIVSFSLWIKEQQEFIYSIEEKYLSSEPEPEMMAAGIHQLNEFGDMVTVDALAKGDILKYDETKALPYFRVYEKLKLDKVNRDIEKRYQKIMEEKAKRKR